VNQEHPSENDFIMDLPERQAKLQMTDTIFNKQTQLLDNADFKLQISASAACENICGHLTWHVTVRQSNVGADKNGREPITGF
jgi:hypothetical protein